MSVGVILCLVEVSAPRFKTGAVSTCGLPQSAEEARAGFLLLHFAGTPVTWAYWRVRQKGPKAGADILGRNSPVPAIGALTKNSQPNVGLKADNHPLKRKFSIYRVPHSVISAALKKYPWHYSTILLLKRAEKELS
ncbi:hypothetical protein ACFSC6_20030 [Rufibacter sediminis]|uniref:Uncharacterized protein n=1 Tax=Rufibacter sediminis TaxID=2762756 RepID=A0ABR6VNH5_9BACT|nr:hypothetical protein [Rufibacter sediminis]MBC3538739.1 hypothetical protein [Rufibacter sediminis]